MQCQTETIGKNMSARLGITPTQRKLFDLFFTKKVIQMAIDTCSIIHYILLPTKAIKTVLRITSRCQYFLQQTKLFNLMKNV